MSRVLFLLAALAVTVSAIAPVPTTPHFPCYECATNGSCAHASWTGDAGKYCGTFSSKTTLVPQWCCCAVAQACPVAGRDTLCACYGPTPAHPTPVADSRLRIFFGLLFGPGVIFILYTLSTTPTPKLVLPKPKLAHLRRPLKRDGSRPAANTTRVGLRKKIRRVGSRARKKRGSEISINIRKPSWSRRFRLPPKT
ncbi:hypothetical protein SPRG_09835 [Saprolegnia parasitica CBS 223.65]|uniref:Uncharacterized protein n=1 Tax=Saprolegnia parasitica (strain CBS 223.65) TaxID=695850 RepID=A0A067C5L9_SAPPC|nr:hypothetical protein SPRG_09835 [Saprolegnia parasitica CBS 223.65]KDO24445.1 hypothetical protein SPRG_09835 [Saprolegnia parasitica CBS 223.65]|eukprot:XP_012204875.1 hypothetical protein SPRG_09835 [Saprolegnia parasitica CBS 223.65]